MLHKIQNYIEKHALFQPGEKLLIAVSGGPDSVALLEIMVSLEKYDLAVAHFNHLTRGEASDGDEAFSAALAAKFQLPFFVERQDVKNIAQNKKTSFENVARDLRYQFLRNVAAGFGAQKILLGHHADDQAETLLLNLLRGSGLKGLGGMAPLDGDLARPLLEITREEIIAYLKQNNIAYRIDASNADIYFTRNHLRHVVMPLLHKFNPSLHQVLANTSEIIRAEAGYLSVTAREYYDLLAVEKENEVTFSRGALRKLDIALQRRIILLAFAKVADTTKDFSFRHVEDVVRLLTSGSGRQIDLPYKLSAITTYDKIHIQKVKPSLPSAPLENLPLNVPGKTCVAGIGWFEASYQKLAWGCSDAFTVYIQEENIALPYSIRSRKLGDIFRPLGGVGKVKLKEFFIDAHLQRELRDQVPIIEDANGEIIWVVGYRPSTKCGINKSGKMLKITFQPE